ncbi:hypothetical protein PCANC_24730 [Puccinia coronata f. sp. avenae]|uniref:Uncharacterized protein n=1 Tax=Puccinia coronata f. sp. avenae TaxID=200324 RepID=A0A2N5S3A8_9BASI|nr:hypothetical protein PCANC_24730 [Puccinia coronata f. sp. avenae]
MSSYQKLLPKERRKNGTASETLQQLAQQLQQPPAELDPVIRRTTIRTILSDLEAHLAGSTDWSTDTTLHALVALKLLGRSAIATDDLISQLPLFTRYANLLPSARFSYQSDDANYHNIIQESLRIIANTLFLHPLSRSSPHLLPALPSLVHLAITLPPSHPTNQQPPLNYAVIQLTSFLASRAVFLITAAASNLVIELIEKTELVHYLKRSFQHQLTKSIHPHAHPYPPISQDVIIEHLKIIFNLMVHYPTSVQQFPRPGSPSVTPTSTASPSDPNHSSDPVFSHARRPSLKARLMNQINMTKKMTRRPRSETSTTNPKDQDALLDPFASQEDHSSSHSPSRHTRSYSKASSRVSSVDQDAESLDTTIDPLNQRFAGLLPYLVQLFLLESIPDPPNLQPPLSSFMHTFLNFSPSTLSFFIQDYKLVDDSSRDPEIPPVIAKLITIIDRVTQYYCPGDPDDRAVKTRCNRDSIDLEVDLTQVVLLTANLISPHALPNSNAPVGLSKQAREALVEKIIPSNLDRNVGLNKQDNLIGRILRLMNSVAFDNLKHTCGAFLSGLYENNTDRLTSHVGYGPLAGYLLSIGKVGLNAESRDGCASEINPITGTSWASMESGSESEQKPMTEQEKEEEVERMCSMFDRMNRSGVISAPDPRKLAVESGRFEEIEQAVLSQEQEEEKQEEMKALRDLELYKQKKKTRQETQ